MRNIDYQRDLLIRIKMPFMRRALYTGSTIAMWLLMLYFFQDFPKAVAALMLDLEVAAERGWTTEPLPNTGRLLVFFFLTTLFFVAFLGFWSWVNHMRFARMQRRRRPPDVTSGELAVSFGLKEDQIAEIRARKVVTVLVDDHEKVHEYT